MASAERIGIHECSTRSREGSELVRRPVIVLVEPLGERNVGAVARVMKNFGFSDLRLVHPVCDHLSLESRKMAMRAEDVLKHARLFPSLASAVRGCRRVVATTARVRQAHRVLQGPEVILRQCAADSEETALVFGGEEAGLKNEHLELADLWMTFPTVPGARSLNLSQSVGIACYEFHRLSQVEPVPVQVETRERPLLHEDFVSLLADAERFLWSVNFLQVNTRNARMRRLTHMLRRSGLSEADGRFLKALFHCVDRARERKADDA